MWRENSSDVANTARFEATAASEAFYAKLQELSPQNDSQTPASPGDTGQHRHCAKALAAVRADEQFNSHALSGGADFLAQLCIGSTPKSASQKPFGAF
jgi:hypothetical protein